ncbi:MAG: AAA family ATPase, partial [Gemmatimonadetes bacterium]|nr:AAA family ATPase [Gemmatimonadota bacterium]
LEHKRKVVEREGLLEYYPAEEAMADIADLATIKDWLAKRKSIITEPARAKEFGLEFPKGILLVGVPGSGKSLCAKAVATEWTLPLLKLDPGGLYNKYVGETEKNFRRAMETAERMAPVVLWIDELEKAFAESGGGGEDGGVSTRVLGTFLSWMQERRGDVFVVATANAVERLPPEFLRKGRFDEVFFVDLPDDETRRAIFRIHLGRRNQDPARFDLPALAAASDGFSGAEIEQVIIAGLYTAFAASGTLTDDVLLAEVRATRPLSVVAAERIAALRRWADGRTVAAN